MEPYKWYKASEILPEETELERDNNGVAGFFVVALNNGDLYCATRWLNGTYWFWDTDNDFSDSMIERDGITHWMKLEFPGKDK